MGVWLDPRVKAVLCGTGGYGAESLRSTLHKPFFPDLWAIRGDRR